MFEHDFFSLPISDDARDIHGDDDLKRQRNQYNGDQIYSNVIINFDSKLNLSLPLLAGIVKNSLEV